MRRKKILAAGLSALLVMSMAGTVWGGESFSDDKEHVIDSVSVSGDSSGIGDSTDTALTVGGKDTKVTVEGDVTASGSSTIGIEALGGSTTVKGNVSSGGTGIVAVAEVGSSDPSVPEVTVEGKVSADGMGIIAWEDSKVTVGSLESGNQALSVSNAEVTVKGDVKAGTSGDGESISMNGNSSIVLIGGDLSFQEDSEEVRLGFSATEDEKSEFAIGGVLQNEDTKVILAVIAYDEESALDLPEIVIGEVADFSNLEVENRKVLEGYIPAELTDAQKDQVLSNIKYIVSSNKDSLSGKGTLQITKVDGNALDRDRADQYDVAKATETITVHVNVASGYKLTGLNAGKASVVRNTDGSYSVTVPQGGGVNIEALIQAIESQERERRSHTASSWKQNTNGTWNYIKQDGTRASNEWSYLEWNGESGWYHFDENGQMQTGWFQDSDGSWYYLNPASDGSCGKMLTGWQQIENEWCYFDENGRMVIGNPGKQMMDEKLSGSMGLDSSQGEQGGNSQWSSDRNELKNVLMEMYGA